jgi:hypothetical protein
VLNHLGPWKIESAAGGSAPTKELDPRGRSLEIEVGGDPQGREALATIEVFEGETSIGQTRVTSGTASGTRMLYTGPSLEPLFSGGPREVELRVVARDRAGQEEEARASFRIAGAPAAFLSEGTGFVGKAEPGAALLPYRQVQVLLPDYGLRIETTARAQARVFLEPADEPVVVREVAGPLVLALKDLRITGTSDLSGSLRVEIDDSPWVDRAAPRPETRQLAFHFTPRPPELQASLVGDDGWRRDLIEQRDGEITNPVDARESVRLAVSPTAGAQLWLEAACARELDGAGEPARMTRTGSEPFELPLELPHEGGYRIVVHKFVMSAGDQKGPPIPPEHVFRIEVDRKAPVVAFELEGAESTDAGGLPLFKGAFSQRIVANVTESVGLEELVLTLRKPNGGQSVGFKFGAGSRVELPPLDEFQKADGRYTLEGVARDKAGNQGSKSVTWHVARRGPELELLEPSLSSSDKHWILGDGKRWNVQVRASDPNDVAAVRARVVYRSKPRAELELVRSNGDFWELSESDRQTAFFWWTGNELALELTARDGAGLESHVRVGGIVPELAKTGEYVIAARDRPRETMVEVEVGGAYTFGGRKGSSDARSWNVEVKNLRSFYLDTREVTRGEFLDFVRAPVGFMDPARWPAGAGPDAKRAADLERRLAGDLDRPATGIAWPEARAYAAWRGKRLPTLVEWEYAVRGPEYAPRPTRVAPPKADAGWPANLCDEPREWTATPEDLVAEALDFPSQCKRFPELLCPPPASSANAAPASAGRQPAALATSHWVVGQWPGGPQDWTARETCADAPAPDDVGFRCALDRESAHSLLDGGQYRLVE